MRGRDALALALALPLGGAGGLGACEPFEPVTQFVARRWDHARKCLERPAVVDVLDEAGPGTCSGRRCFVAPSGAVFVTEDVCRAPPDYEEVTAPKGTMCELALEAAEDPDATCE